MAIICVESGKVLWSTAHDPPSYPSTPWGRLVTLNHTALAYITQSELGPMLCVRDVLTGEIKATKPIPDSLLPFPLADEISIQLHPRRDLAYIAVNKKVFFFSTATANCVGRLSVPSGPSTNEEYHQDRLSSLCFSEHQPKCNPSTREKFFLCKYNINASGSKTYRHCFEYEVPTDEDISISEARILQNGNQGSEDYLIFKVLRMQIYEHQTWYARDPPGLNPMLKQSAQTETGYNDPVNWRGKKYMRVKFETFTTHQSLSEWDYKIFLESEKPHDGSIPIEFYPCSRTDLFVTLPKRTPGHVGRHNERDNCLLPRASGVSITVTERYMFVSHQNVVYLFVFEPEW